MNDIVKNIRTHRLILRDGREFLITKEQYNSIRMDKENSKRTDLFKLKDADTGKTLFDGEFGAISEFVELENPSINETRWICEYGGRHHLHMECNCSKYYNNFPKYRVLPAMWYLGYTHIDNSRFFTTEMKQKLAEASKDSEFLNKVKDFYTNVFLKK